ncbi:MAG: metallophosphoesterase [Tyzzerella sp.]|nr:metallophosphoesterase [Tyzzerella sp.]
MKKKYCFLLGLLICGCIGVAGIWKVVDAQKQNQLKDYTAQYEKLDENYIGADFSGREIAYSLDSSIKDNINTFECWIRLDESADTKGVIFGDYCYYNIIDGVQRSTNWQISKDGNVQVYWAGTTVTFEGYDVRNSEWTHLSVVRDTEQKQFLLYVNGEHQATSTNYVDTDVSDSAYRHRIGGDNTESNRKYPFLGEIGQITCYSTARTAEQIKQDYQEYDTISYSTRDESLLFNTMLQIGDEVVSDSSINANHARLITNDYFYNGDLYETQDYSFVVIGDTQGLARANQAAIPRYTDWITAQKDEKKISAVFHMGDLTYGNPEVPEETWNAQWEAIANPMKELRTQVPFVCVPGNHDYPNNSLTIRNLDKFNEYFPAEEFESLSYFGGSYEKGKTQNTYYFMEFGNIEYVVIALEFEADSKVLEWACDIMSENSDKRVILITHNFLNNAGEITSESSYFNEAENTIPTEMWEKYLCKHENLFMILCGHSIMETIAYKELKGENGNTVMTFRIDPSNIVAQRGLDTITALFTINESESKLYLNYFSIDKNKLYNIQNQRTIDYSGFTKLTKSYYESR